MARAKSFLSLPLKPPPAGAWLVLLLVAVAAKSQVAWSSPFSADLLCESWPARRMRSLRCSWPSHRASRRTMLRLSRTRRPWLPLRHPRYHRSPVCSLQPPSDHLQYAFSSCM
ncbi:unnamed protein product, partial [Musa acuminata var. zebrina]